MQTIIITVMDAVCICEAHEYELLRTSAFCLCPYGANCVFALNFMCILCEFCVMTKCLKVAHHLSSSLNGHSVGGTDRTTLVAMSGTDWAKIALKMAQPISGQIDIFLHC